MVGTPAYHATRDRVETYFDQTATKAWAALTSDAPVSGIRATVRQGRSEMAELLHGAISDPLGKRILDAGCGTGTQSIALARRGAEVMGIDLSPQLVQLAMRRTPVEFDQRIKYCTGDLSDPGLGSFDHVFAMDSLIYYDLPTLVEVLSNMRRRVRGSIVFTLPPRTPLLMAMWRAGRLFPASDRSPTMVPHGRRALIGAFPPEARPTPIGEVRRGFYISTAYHLEGAA